MCLGAVTEVAPQRQLSVTIIIWVTDSTKVANTIKQARQMPQSSTAQRKYGDEDCNSRAFCGRVGREKVKLLEAISCTYNQRGDPRRKGRSGHMAYENRAPTRIGQSTKAKFAGRTAPTKVSLASTAILCTAATDAARVQHLFGEAGSQNAEQCSWDTLSRGRCTPNKVGTNVRVELAVL